MEPLFTRSHHGADVPRDVGKILRGTALQSVVDFLVRAMFARKIYSCETAFRRGVPEKQLTHAGQ